MFFGDEDDRGYLALWQKCAGRHGVRLYGYCLMPNHVHLAPALRYVERSPVRAGLAAHPWDYPWSRARARVTGVDPSGLLDLADWDAAWPGDRWREYLGGPEPPGEIDILRRATHVGRPRASPAQLAELETATGRRLQPQPVG